MKSEISINTCEINEGDSLHQQRQNELDWRGINMHDLW